MKLFTLRSKKQTLQPPFDIDGPIDALKQVYNNFNKLNYPPLCEADFIVNPFVLCVGQYSTGKTTFVRYMVGKDFLKMRIGPEPTTDSFSAVMYGEEDNAIPARADKPFQNLNSFGLDFLKKFECIECNSPYLKNINFVDTPGVLSGAKGSTNRGYDFVKVISWFGKKADRIVVFFDANKLDISDEMNGVIRALKPYEYKICCVLNKADGVSQDTLLRVYGALMYNLGKSLDLPEVPRIYVGSFWQQPTRSEFYKELFEAEETSLFEDLSQLPKSSSVRKVNEVLQRGKQLYSHCKVIEKLKKELKGSVFSGVV